MFNDILKSVGPMIAAAMAGKFERGEFRFDNVRFGKFGFDGSGFDFDSGPGGQPLADLDLTQNAPDRLVLAGNASVEIIAGEGLAITASGDGADALRFALHEGKLIITRTGGGAPAHVTLTMPPPRALSVAGSGVISTTALAPQARVSVAGSGAIHLDAIDAERLKASLMGSGQLIADGQVGQLKLAIAGSGTAFLAHLEAESAKLSIAGSGSALLASDGTVEARMMGSGDVTLFGQARLSIHAMGSGNARCLPREDRPPFERVPMEARWTERRRDNQPSSEDGPDAARPAKPAKPPKPSKPAKPPKPRKAKSAKPAKGAAKRKLKGGTAD